MAEILEKQREAFRAKFGREPGPDDPIFFDPEADEPRSFDDAKVSRAMVSAMEAAGTRPEIIFAYRRTGLLVSEDNYRKLTPEDRAEWRAALEEYGELKRRSN